MDRRIAILGIIVENTDSVERVNELLHEYREFIVGRMGMRAWDIGDQRGDGCGYQYGQRSVRQAGNDTGCQCQGSLFQGIIDQPVLPENLSYR